MKQYDVHRVVDGEFEIINNLTESQVRKTVAKVVEQYALDKAYNIYIDPYRLIISDQKENVSEVSWYESY